MSILLLERFNIKKFLVTRGSDRVVENCVPKMASHSTGIQPNGAWTSASGKTENMGPLCTVLFDSMNSITPPGCKQQTEITLSNNYTGVNTRTFQGPSVKVGFRSIRRYSSTSTTTTSTDEYGDTVGYCPPCKTCVEATITSTRKQRKKRSPEVRTARRIARDLMKIDDKLKSRLSQRQECLGDTDTLGDGVYGSKHPCIPRGKKCMIKTEDVIDFIQKNKPFNTRSDMQRSIRRKTVIIPEHRPFMLAMKKYGDRSNEEMLALLNKQASLKRSLSLQQLRIEPGVCFTPPRNINSVIGTTYKDHSSSRRCSCTDTCCKEKDSGLKRSRSDTSVRVSQKLKWPLCPMNVETTIPPKFPPTVERIKPIPPQPEVKVRFWRKPIPCPMCPGDMDIQIPRPFPPKMKREIPVPPQPAAYRRKECKICSNQRPSLNFDPCCMGETCEQYDQPTGIARYLHNKSYSG